MFINKIQCLVNSTFPRKQKRFNLAYFWHWPLSVTFAFKRQTWVLHATHCPVMTSVHRIIFKSFSANRRCKPHLTFDPEVWHWHLASELSLERNRPSSYGEFLKTEDTAMPSSYWQWIQQNIVHCWQTVFQY